MSNAAVALLALSLLLVNVVHASTGGLTMLVLLHRHGDRAPADNNAPTNLPDDLFRRQWPLGAGELTAHGMQQLFNLGAQFKQTYSGFLDSTFNVSRHPIRSTDFHRTQQSAQSFAYGMYVGMGPIDPLLNNATLPFAYQPIPVSTVPMVEDNLLDPEDWAAAHCSNYYDAFTTQRSWTDLQFRSANFLMELNQVLNSTFQPSQWPILDITNVNDVFLCEEAHGALYSSFPTLTPQLRAAALNLTIEFQKLYNYHPVDVKRLLAGRMVHDILEAIDLTLEGKKPYKLFHYSAHDSTVQPMLVALGVFDGNMIPYAANIVMELKVVDSVESITVNYNGNSLALPFCNHMISCPYRSMFRAHLSSFAVAPDQIDSICVPLNPPSPSPVDRSFTRLELILIIVSVCLTLLMISQQVRYSSVCKSSPSQEFLFPAAERSTQYSQLWPDERQ